jgi:hypothetical protein
MRPESVEIKVNLAGANIDGAIAQLGLDDGQTWTVVFCEDVTTAAATTALLDIGVVLRARGKSQTTGDSTIKLRPSRWSQLDPDYFMNWERGDEELKVEADWSDAKRSLATSLTAKWSDSRLSDAQAGQLTVPQLFTDEQLTFLSKCSQGRVNLEAISLLPPIAATRWPKFKAPELSVEVRAERWQVDEGLDFLELSIVSTPAEAVSDQDALTAFVARMSLPVDDDQASKTQRVLEHLIARST